MRLIPGKTKVQIELFKGVSLWDIVIGAIGIIMVVAAAFSSMPHRFYIVLGIMFVFVALLARIDSTPNYIYLLHILRHFSYKRYYERVSDDTLLAQSGHGESEGETLEKSTGKKKQAKAVEQSTTNRQQSRKEERALYKEESKKLKDKRISEEEKNEIWKARAQRTAAKKRAKAAYKPKKCAPMEELIPFTGISDGQIEFGGKYYGAVIEIPPVEFRFFSSHRRAASIEGGVGKILRNINPDYSANIVKIERPVNYDRYLELEYDKLDELKHSFESGLINEEELKARVEVLYDRISELNDYCGDKPVIVPFFYIVLYENEKRQLENQIQNALDSLQYGEIDAKRLDDKELATFLKYTNDIDFDERDIEHVDSKDYALYAMPKSVKMHSRMVLVNNIQTYNMRMCGYPTMVGDAWLATVMSMPATKVVIKCKTMERSKAMRTIDRSLGELRGQLRTTGLDSKALELQEHIASLSELLATLQQDNENLLQVNIYVTAYDIIGTRNNPKIEQPPVSNRATFGSMKKAVRRLYKEQGLRLMNMEFDQEQAFIGSQISGWDPLPKEARGIPSNSIAAAYPWIFANVSDEGGFKLGRSEGVPVFLNFFRRDNERVNSNMVIVGKSGSGKSYATKDILTNLAAEDAKIFILDPENEYSELARNLHGKFINVGNAQHGRINPFHIITAVDDDMSDGAAVTGSYATHLQFLEEFFRQILPDCDKDALEYLNNLVDRMYTNFGITAETDLSKLSPEDYPIFDDLYDAVLAEFQQTDNAYIRTILRSLMNYIAKFSTGGRNANIWNGPSTITTDENFTVFNFQSLLSNRNGTIANAQMLLVLKYIDNEIIKNRDYNTRYHLNRKIVVAIDEAHVFIDTKFPVALDFMFQLAKRIRKYNGMQIVITQNIKDFVGSEEIARKSTAIINACQYSLIFSLAPNDMHDLCTLYEKAGGINEMEQEKIMMAPRGQAFAVMGPASRSTFRVEVPDSVVDMFQNDHYDSAYFTGEGGEENWEEFIGESRTLWEKNRPVRQEHTAESVRTEKKVIFTELTPEESELENLQNAETKGMYGSGHMAEPAKTSKVTFSEETAPSASKVTFSEETADVSPSKVTEPTELEKMLVQTLGQFSHETMLDQIKKAVQDEVQRELANVKPVVSDTPKPEFKSEQPQETDFRPETEFEQPQEADFGPETEPEEISDYEKETQTEQQINDDTSDFWDMLRKIGEDNISSEDIDITSGGISIPGESIKLPNIDTSDDEFDDDYDTDMSDDEFDTDDYDTDTSDDEFDDDYDTDTSDDEFDDDYDTDTSDDEFDDDYDTDMSDDEFDTDDNDTDTSDSDEGADIFSLLLDQVKENDSVNPIDMMEVYEEKVIDISLEDLASYILKHR